MTSFPSPILAAASCRVLFVSMQSNRSAVSGLDLSVNSMHVFGMHEEWIHASFIGHGTAKAVIRAIHLGAQVVFCLGLFVCVTVTVTFKVNMSSSASESIKSSFQFAA